MTRNDVAVERLHKAQRQVGGVEVTYRRGNASIDTLTLVRADTRHDDYGDDVTFSALDQDWIAWADDLVIAGERIYPDRKDEIDWIDGNGTKRTYRVLPRIRDRCFRRTGPSDKQFRIYSVEQLPNSE